MASDTVATASTLSDRTQIAMREALDGERQGWRAVLPFAGPAVIASVAYMDPGNFATNIQAGASYGYALLWVVVLANLVAVLFQALSARLGIVTGRNLAELCRERLPRWLIVPMWLISEVAAMATDLAEFLGGAIGLSLLFGLPLFWGMVVTGFIVWGILVAGGAGFRPIELIIGALVGMIGLGYLAELVISPPAWGQAALGSVLPSLPDANALTLAVGIVGATVMPHAIYLHSGLTQARGQPRHDEDRRRLVRFSDREVIVALAVAGLVNMAMVAMAASAFHAGHSDVAEIETAYQTLGPLLGRYAAGVFLISLMASGISSSVVGTMAGQVVMQGFLRVRVPIWARRLVTMLPAFAVVWAGVNATEALVLSQVVLSLALPVPMLALMWLVTRRALMGRFVPSRAVTALALVATGLVLALNAVLLWQTVTG